MIHNISDKAIAVEVSEDAEEFRLTRIHADLDLVCPNGNGGMKWIAMIPEGNWQILGRPQELTLEQVYQVMGTLKNGSLNDLLKSKNLEPSNCLILINKV